MTPSIHFLLNGVYLLLFVRRNVIFPVSHVEQRNSIATCFGYLLSPFIALLCPLPCLFDVLLVVVPQFARHFVSI